MNILKTVKKYSVCRKLRSAGMYPTDVEVEQFPKTSRYERMYQSVGMRTLLEPISLRVLDTYFDFGNIGPIFGG